MKERKIRIIKIKKIDSTNTYLRTLAENGTDEGCVVTANEQTAGRGRRGKTFFSPSDTGLYMSILIRPEFSVENSLFLTSMTAVATARAIERVTGIKCGIKWVNDIYVGDKKVSGILCEASFDHTSDRVNYVIVGIGINAMTPKNDFPEELKDIATSLGYEDIRESLLTAVVEEFFDLYDKMPSRQFLKEYRNRSMLIGKRVEILGNYPFSAQVLDIDGDCHLVVMDDSGEIKALSSGEVSAKIIK